LPWNSVARGCDLAEPPAGAALRSDPAALISRNQDSASLRDAAKAVRLVFAAFDRPDNSSRFRGVELATDQARCVAGISRVDGLSRTPLLLTTILTARWRDGALYQRLR
jgi:hypothetical protein